MAKKSTATDRFSPGHHMGKFYGYDVTPEGGIKLAPALTEPLQQIIERDHGLHALVRATSSYAADEFTRLGSAKRAWWDRVADDLGLPKTESWMFDPLTGILTLKPNDQSGGKPEQER